MIVFIVHLLCMLGFAYALGVWLASVTFLGRFKELHHIWLGLLVFFPELPGWWVLVSIDVWTLAVWAAADDARLHFRQAEFNSAHPSLHRTTTGADDASPWHNAIWWVWTHVFHRT